MKYFLMAGIRIYQWTISPIIGPVCRFYPSCSRYSYEALANHGALRGTYLAIRRLTRCHPWHPGGIDLVPPPKKLSRSSNHPLFWSPFKGFRITTLGKEHNRGVA